MCIQLHLLGIVERDWVELSSWRVVSDLSMGEGGLLVWRSLWLHEEFVREWSECVSWEIFGETMLGNGSTISLLCRVGD